MKQLYAYSQLLDEPEPLGSPSDDVEALFDLGDMMATSRPGIIVYLDNPPLQPWEDS